MSRAGDCAGKWETQFYEGRGKQVGHDERKGPGQVVERGCADVERVSYLVDGRVPARLGECVWVNIGCPNRPRPKLGQRYGQDAGSGAKIECPLGWTVLYAQRLYGFQAGVRGGMVSGTKSHTGVNDNAMPVGLIWLRLPRRKYEQTLTDT